MYMQRMLCAYIKLILELLSDSGSSGQNGLALNISAMSGTDSPETLILMF